VCVCVCECKKKSLNVFCFISDYKARVFSADQARQASEEKLAVSIYLLAFWQLGGFYSVQYV